MQEQERRDLRELIGKAAGDGTARVAIEDMVLAWDRAGRADAVAAALELVAMFGPRDLHQVIVTRLQANDYSRQQWPMIG